MFIESILKPSSHIFLKANAVHEVVDGFFQSQSQEIVIDARWVNETYVVLAKTHRGQRNQFNAIFFGI